MPRKEEIEAAVAAYNATDQRAPLLPPEATRLLAAMFPRDTMFQGRKGSILAKGFDNRTLSPLLRTLIAAGFVSKGQGRRGWIPTYRLHLPPQVRS